MLDKGFVQAAKITEIHSLASDYTLVVTSSFYCEGFQRPDESRTKIFAALPEFRRIHTADLYRFERESHSPAISCESPALTVNPEFIAGERKLTDSEAQAVRAFENEIVVPGIDFWKSVMEHGVLGFEDGELKRIRGNDAAFIDLCGQLNQIRFVRQMAYEMGLEIAGAINPQWLTFRWIQTNILHGLTLRYLYSNASQRRKELDLEHDIHDLDYLALALHAGAFATSESRGDFRKLGWRFKFLRPDGRLIQRVLGDNGPTLKEF